MTSTATSSSSIEIVQYSHAVHSKRLPEFATILIESMEQDGLIATFTRPWNPDFITKWYEERAVETERPWDYATDPSVQKGARAIVMAFEKKDGSKDELVGYIMLAASFNQTGPFRSSVEKLVVSPQHRRKGIARLLMAKLEQIALQRKRTLIIPDTEEGSPAEKIYPKLGYTEFGRIPMFGISPVEKRGLAGAVGFYKILPQHEELWAPEI
ncbi:acetyltransferase [Flagelloscypha sp. PMI_526]|nr:acetyltransferase [Flagelloscypha sp. PMI_526]